VDENVPANEFRDSKGEEEMNKPKNVFDWKDGTSSIWTRDKELRQIAQGRAWGQAVQAKIGLESKQQITIYSRAKSSK
jgi:hypothetical protein